MDIPDKIRTTREKAGFSQKQVADRVGMTQQSYEAIEAGRTQRSKYLPRIANVLGLDLAELDPELGALAGPEKPAGTTIVQAPQLTSATRDFPIYASAEGGPGEIIRSADPVDFMPRPAPLAHVRSAYGLYLTGESMVPEFWPGEVAMVNPVLPIVSNVPAILYTEMHGEARATIKRILRASSDKWTLQQWNPKREFTLSRREWGVCHRVIGKYYQQ